MRVAGIVAVDGLRPSVEVRYIGQLETRRITSPGLQAQLACVEEVLCQGSMVKGAIVMASKVDEEMVKRKARWWVETTRERRCDD